jgi:hypothetical protein
MSPTLPIDPAAPARQERPSRVWLILALILSLVALVAGVYSARDGRQIPAAQPALSPEEAVSALRISLPQAGAYRITQAELRRAGWQVSLQDAPDISLLQRGKSQPFWMDDSEQASTPDEPALVFYAPPSTSPYTPESVFVLVDDSVAKALPAVFQPQDANPASLAAEPVPLPQGLPAGSYLAVQHSEQNLLYRPQTEGDERWFWLLLSGGKSQPVSLEADQIALPASGGGNRARLRVRVYSDSEAPASPDHHLRLLVNGQPVADETWDGRGWREIEAWFDPAWLAEGENQVTLEAPGEAGVVADIYHLDWVELAYPRGLQAQDDRLDFWSPGGSLSLSGFTSPVDVFDITDPEAVTRLQEVVEKEGSIGFESQAGRHYLAVGRDGWLSPGSLEPLVLQPDLRSPSNGADYVAIGPPDLLEPLQPLLDLRREQGFSPLAVPVQAVYDQFNYGLAEPQAIQRFLQYATQNWQTAPRFVFLVGDASYDPLGYQAPAEANRLPVFLIDTIYGGQTASDVGYVQLNQDGWPDLALGILPARSADQVAVVVEKTLAYEAALAAGALPGNILAVADGQEAGFEKDARAFLNLFGEAYPAEVFAPPAGAVDAASQIEAQFVDGQGLVAYFGHGSLKMWGKDKLFTVEDAARLEHDTLPVVLNMTCLTGLYTHPQVESLAEAFLFNPHGGAVAVLAPSSLTLAGDQSFLSRPLVQEMLADPDATLGQAHLAARRQISLDSPGQRDVMMTFILFGDPALSLPLSASAAAHQ